MLSDTQRHNLIERIYQIDELFGVTIGYYGDGMCSVLGPGFAMARNYGRIMLIVEETVVDRSLVDATRLRAEPVPQTRLPTYVANRSQISAELVGATASCTLALISGVGVFAGAAAEVPTAGASTILLVASWTGFVMSSVQCVNGVVRAAAAIADPDSNSLQRADSSEIYRGVMMVVDSIGVVTSLASLPSAWRNLLAVVERRAAQRGLAAAIERASRDERRRLMEEAVRQATRTTQGAEEVRLALQAANLTRQQARNVVNYGASTLRQTRIVQGVLTEVSAFRLHRAVQEIIGGVGGIAASASPAQYTGSASGVINTMIVHAFFQSGPQ